MFNMWSYALACCLVPFPAFGTNGTLHRHLIEAKEESRERWLGLVGFFFERMQRGGSAYEICEVSASRRIGTETARWTDLLLLGYNE